jgi:hypothetical protein
VPILRTYEAVGTIYPEQHPVGTCSGCAETRILLHASYCAACEWSDFDEWPL